MKRSMNRTIYLTLFLILGSLSSLLQAQDERDALLEDNLITGTVFDDVNGNGVQDPGEPGIPYAQIVTVDGFIITTDQYGRYHLEGVKGASSERGFNYLLKVDPASLPENSVFITSNPLVKRILPGLPAEFDFAIQISDESVLKVNEQLFLENTATINPEFDKVVLNMVKAIKAKKIKNVYLVTKSDSILAKEREIELASVLNSYLTKSQRVSVKAQYKP